MGQTRISKFACYLLALLVVSNSATVVLGYYTLTATGTDDKSFKDRYSVQNMIIITECFKFVLAAILEEHHSYWGLKVALKNHVLRNPRDALKMALPAGLFLLQNLVLYRALSYLSIATFEVIYQSKLLILAALSVTLLGRSYSSVQWLSLVTLVAGICVTVLGAIGDFNVEFYHHTIRGVGFALIASFAGPLSWVYFEKLVKIPHHSNIGGEEGEDGEVVASDQGYNLVDNNTGIGEEICNPSDENHSNSRESDNSDLLPASLWMRTMQLSFFCLLVAVGQKVFNKLFGNDIYSGGEGKSFFHGFNVWVWSLILVNSFSGILISAIIKYADNVLKGLATSASMILSTTLSHFLFDAPLNSTVFFGMLLVAGSVLGFCVHIGEAPSRPIGEILATSPLFGGDRFGSSTTTGEGGRGNENAENALASPLLVI